jgi:DNA-binding beta-propeller fold protein YncE
MPRARWVAASAALRVSRWTRGGNVYVADTGNSLIKEIPVGCVASNCVVTLGGSNSFRNPQGVAVDASGDVYVADLGDAAVKEIVAVGGSIPSTNPTITTLGTGFTSPSGVAVDANGNVYVADWGNKAVYEILKAGGYATVNTLGGGFSHPEGVAVDASGHVFVADGGSQAVAEIPVGCASSACVTQLAGYYFSFQPIGIAVDASGDIFVAGGGAQTKTVYEILAVSGSIPSANPTVVALGGGLSEPTGVAADSSGNVYVADYLNNRVEELETQGVNFGTVAIGQTTAAIPLTFTFDSAGSIGSPAALTRGATGLDFALDSGGSCSAGTSFNVGDTCTLNVTFTPKYPGLRYGAAVLKDGSGNTIATAYVHGIGSGPQVGYQPGPLSVRSYPYIGILAERGIAVDSSGNVFIANYKNTDPNAVIDEISAGCATTACVKPLAGLFSIPWGVAVDGAGNVFVADESAGELSEIQASGGHATVKTLGGAYGNPISVAVDGSGNLFFADTGSGTAKEALASSGYATVKTLASGLYLPGGIAVDSSGNVFISDTGNHAVKEIEAVNGSVPASPVINSLGSGFQYPQGIAVDSSGNVFVLDSGTSAQAAYEILAADGYTTVKTLSKGFDSPTGMALDQTGNLQIVDGEYLETLDRSDAPALSFATPTPPGLTDTADGPKTATIQNIGTMPLTFTGMSLSGANFQIDSGTTTCSASTVLAVGASCTVGVVFAPVTTGTALTGTLTLTDNALNQPGTTQQITFSGKGMLSPTVSVTPSSQSLTTAQGLTVTVAVSGGSGNPTPTGSVTLVGGGYNSGTTALSGGSATFDIPAGALAMGADSLTASYTPDSTSASVYTQALSSAISVNVTAMAAPTVTVEPSSLSITTAQALTVTVAVGGGSGNPAPTGTVTITGGGYTSAAATLSGGSATFNLSAGALAVGADTLTASYTPDSVSLPIYSVSTGSSTVTVAFGAAPSGSGSFGTVAIGQSAAISLTFTFSSSATLASPVALTQGASGLDFAVAAGGTCATGASFSAGQTCQVNVTFKPKYAGIRYGAVVLEGNSGSPIAMAYLSGVGSGPQVSFLPYAQSTLGGSFGTPNTVAVDGSGNVYVADYTDEVKMIPPGCASASCVTTVGGGFNAAGGVAVDGAGNVFVADSLNSAVKEIPPGCVSAGCVQTLSTNFVFPEAVAVDGSGNLFVAELGPLSSGEADSAPNGSVKEILAAGGYTTVNTLSSGINTISGVAVDAASNVFIAFGGNQSNSAVEEISAAGGYATAHILTIGLNGPGGVAVDGVGNLYVVDYGNLALKELPVTSNYSTVNTLVSFGLNATPNSVTVDASGNIYLAIPAASPAGGVFKLDYADAPALAFRTTTAGTTDTVDGTKTVTLENIGNAALQLSGLALPSTNFSTAVAATTCTSSATLAAGTSCAVGVQFVPRPREVSRAQLPGPTTR